MQNITFIRIVFFLLAFPIHAAVSQNLATVSLITLDEDSGEPLAAAVVRLMQLPDSQLIGGILTNGEGRGSLEGVPQGSYLVLCNYLGYEEKAVPLLVGELNQYYDLGKIFLTPASTTVDEVLIEGEQSNVSSEMDRKVFSIDENISQAGGSVVDAMRNLPGVTVDSEGKILIRGSDQVAILIDGKQSSLTGFGNQKGLENIPAANIERIEIINNPSAKYDASGMAGIINIVYKDDQREGLNGEAGFTYGLGEITTRREDLPTDLGRYSMNPKYLPSLSLNYQKGSVRAFVRGELLHQRKLPNNEFNTRTYDNGDVIISQVPENRTQTQYILNGGLDWQINEQNLLGFSTLVDYESHVDTSEVPYINLTSDVRDRFWRWREQETTGYLNYQANYRHLFAQPGHTLDVSLQYTRGIEDENYDLNDSSEVRIGRDTTHIVAIEHTSVGLINYVKPLASGRLEAGTKVQIRRIPVTYEIGQGAQSIIYPNLGEYSNWGEDIYAGYLNYIWEKPRFELESGLRAEQTQVFYSLDPVNIYYDQNDAYQYFQLYPNVRFTLKLKPQHGLSIFYNRRVDRPGEPELRVFPKYDDPELLKVGNPYLRPQFTQTVELAYRYSWDRGSFFISGYYRLIDNPFTRVYAIDTTSLQYPIVNRIYQNVGSGTQQGIEILATQQLASFWKLSGSLNLYQNTIHAYTGTLLFPYQREFSIDETVANTWDAKLNSEWQLPANLRIQLSGLYYAPFNIPQGRQLARGSVDLGVKKALWNQRGELTLSATDIFNQFGIRQEITGDGFTNEYQNYYETQVVRLGLKYRF